MPALLSPRRTPAHRKAADPRPETPAPSLHAFRPRLSDLPSRLDPCPQTLVTPAKTLGAPAPNRKTPAQNLKTLAQNLKAFAQNRKTLPRNRKTLAQNLKALAQNRKALPQNLKTLAQNRKVFAQNLKTLAQNLQTPARNRKAFRQIHKAPAPRLQAFSGFRPTLPPSLQPRGPPSPAPPRRPSRLTRPPHPQPHPTHRMSTPLRWDTPGLTFDSGLTYDSSTPNPRPKSMNTTKAVTDLTHESNLALSAAAKEIHTRMTANAATFTAPTVTMAALDAQITDYDTKLAATSSRTPADLIAFDTARDVLEDSLRRLGNYVNSVALGDPAIVNQSGFPAYDTARVPDYSPPNPPENVRVTHGELSGSIVVRFTPQRRGSTNEVQANLGDPNDEAGWVQKVLIQGSRAEVSGLPPGVIVWFRVRSVGLRGVMGAWSDPAQIRTL